MSLRHSLQKIPDFNSEVLEILQDSTPSSPRKYGISDPGSRMGKGSYRAQGLKESQDMDWFSFLYCLSKPNDLQTHFAFPEGALLDDNLDLQEKLRVIFSSQRGRVKRALRIRKWQQTIRKDNLELRYPISESQKAVLRKIVNLKRDAHNQIAEDEDIEKAIMPFEWKWIQLTFENFVREEREKLKKVNRTNKETQEKINDEEKPITVTEMVEEAHKLKDQELEEKIDEGLHFELPSHAFWEEIEWRIDENVKRFLLNQLDDLQREILSIFAGFVDEGLSIRRAFGLLSPQQKITLKQVLNIINSYLKERKRRTKKRDKERRNLKSRDPFAFAEGQRKFYELEEGLSSTHMPSDLRRLARDSSDSMPPVANAA